MPQPLRIAIVGATGRMGRALIDNIVDSAELDLSAAVTRADDPMLGQDAGVLAGRGALGIPAGTDVVAAVRGCDVIVDFSRPEATLATLESAVRERRPMVVGTTGFDDAQLDRLNAAAREIPICRAANFSIGVNVCLGLLAQAARVLGPDYDVEVFEAHHRHKVDAPSGTALAMGEAVAGARGQTLQDVAAWARHGHTGERTPGAIGFSVQRAGEIVGEHVVTFAGPGERVEIAHRAASRGNFARGALRAAAWLVGRGPGLYGMRDVLDLP